MKISDFLGELKESYGGSWRETAIDVILHGDPSRELEGVAVTMMATQEAVAEAQRLGCNLLITHEPLFYSHQGRTAFLEGDPVYEEKKRRLDEAGLCVFHLHDNLHSRIADPISRGMARALGWEGARTDESYRNFSLPGQSLERITRQIEEALHPAALRYVGDPAKAYGTVRTAWGFSMLENELGFLSKAESCVFITGETHEWELVEYMRDAGELGFERALVVVGHACSEEAGVEAFASELAARRPEIKVAFVRTGDLFRATRR
jgi:putative NIF3 family GTP cyclohydrolase 1 type 2